MIRKKESSAEVYHDLQKDLYYKVDKLTGKEQRAYKNGMTLRSFKYDVSGNDYKKRRVLFNCYLGIGKSHESNFEEG